MLVKGVVLQECTLTPIYTQPRTSETTGTPEAIAEEWKKNISHCEERDGRQTVKRSYACKGIDCQENGAALFSCFSAFTRSRMDAVHIS